MLTPDQRAPAGGVVIEEVLACGRSTVFKAKWKAGDNQRGVLGIVVAPNHVVRADVVVKVWSDKVSPPRRAAELASLGRDVLCVLDTRENGQPMGFVAPYYGQSLDKMCLCVPASLSAIASAVLRDVGQQLVELHNADNVHMDVWPGNIVVSYQADREPRWQAKLIDGESVTKRGAPTTNSPVQLDFVSTHFRPQESQSTRASTPSMNSADTSDSLSIPQFDWFKLGLVVRFIVDSDYRLNYTDNRAREKQEQMILRDLNWENSDENFLKALYSLIPKNDRDGNCSANVVNKKSVCC